MKNMLVNSVGIGLLSYELFEPVFGAGSCFRVDDKKIATPHNTVHLLHGG